MTIRTITVKHPIVACCRMLFSRAYNMASCFEMDYCAPTDNI